MLSRTPLLNLGHNDGPPTSWRALEHVAYCGRLRLIRLHLALHEIHQHISKSVQPNLYVWVRIQTPGRIAYIVRENRGMYSDYAALA